MLEDEWLFWLWSEMEYYHNEVVGLCSLTPPLEEREARERTRLEAYTETPQLQLNITRDYNGKDN